jgi:hypothetical protein
MSIAATIASLETSGSLTRYVPCSGSSPRRRLYLTQAALKDFTDRTSAVNLLVGRGCVQAALDRWTLGNLIYGDKRGGRFLKRLEAPPPEIWEIRVTEPIVQARLLGRFAEPDTLILTRFYTRPMLGNKGSQAWAVAMNECATIWANTFGTVAPHQGTVIGDYVTENCDAFPI